MRRVEEFDVGDRVQLEVAIPAGNIQLRAASEGVVRVSIDAKDTERFEVFQIGETVTVREESSWQSHNRNVRVVIEAPAGFDLATDTALANVETRGRWAPSMREPDPAASISTRQSASKHRLRRAEFPSVS